MENGGIDQYYRPSDLHSNSIPSAGVSALEEEDAALPTATAPVPSNFSNEANGKLPSEQEIVHALRPTTNSQMSWREKVIELVFGDNHDLDYALCILQLIRDLHHSNKLDADHLSGLSTQPKSAVAAEDDVVSISPVPAQVDHTLEQSSHSLASGATLEVSDFSLTPDSTAHAQCSSHSPSAEVPKLPPTPASDDRILAQESMPKDAASSLLPGQRSSDYGPAPYFIQEGHQTLDWIGNRQWMESDDNAIAELGGNHPFQLMYTYSKNSTRPKEQTPFIQGRADYLKNEVKEGRKTGDGTRKRGSNTAKYTKEVWEAYERDDYLKRKQEARATPAAEGDAGSSISTTATTAGAKKAGEKTYAPVTRRKKEALLLAIAKGEQVLEGVVDSRLKAFLKKTLEEANKKLQKSIREAQNRANAKAKAKEVKGTGKHADADGLTVDEGQAAVGTSSQEKGSAGDVTTSAKPRTMTTAGKNKKRKEVATAGAQSTSSPRKKKKSAPGQKENPPMLPAPVDGAASLTTDLQALHSANTITNAFHNASFGVMHPFGNIPNVPASSLQHALGASSTYADYHFHSTNVTTPHTIMDQPVIGGDASCNYIPPTPYAAQPVAGPSRQSQQMVDYPTSPPHTVSMLIPSGSAHYPFTFTAPRASSSNDFFTPDSTGLSASPHLGNLLESFSNTPMLSPMGVGMGNEFPSNFDASSYFSDGSLTHHEASNTTSSPWPQHSGPDTQQSAWSQNVQLSTPSTPLEYGLNCFDYDFADTPSV